MHAARKLLDAMVHLRADCKVFVQVDQLLRAEKARVVQMRGQSGRARRLGHYEAEGLVDALHAYLAVQEGYAQTEEQLEVLIKVSVHRERMHKR